MLILTRKEGEEVIIGKDGEIRVKIISQKGKQIRLGIEAPKDVPVDRDEIYQKKSV